MHASLAGFASEMEKGWVVGVRLSLLTLKGHGPSTFHSEHTHTHTHNSQDWLASDHIFFSHMPRPQPSTQATSVKKTHSRTTLQEWRGRQCDVHIGSILKSNSLNKSAKQTEFLSGHFVEISKSIRSAESHPL